ncbi:hypothetical protein REC12_10580 [Desulfosporosinus sp. PR]|uniref:hypothetical protein n=1 Tax=Candidatus Desulfosporosinus nitrosoreducens TaxID=3401928 RepID=UPI0027EC111A|nr:hypothetical protein [Desulfosporosinus sp. PR]MDQ7094034.1 hypothetical protein [Desulfosporosinus sp. PR]
MKLGIFFGVLLIVLGLVITFLSFQGWYIDWRKERLRIETSRLIRSERISGFCLIFLGILQTVKALN